MSAPDATYGIDATYGVDATYGIVYKPTPDAAPPTPAAIAALCSTHSIAFVRVQWLDLTNLTRFRVLPIAYFLSLLRTPRPGVCLPAATLGFVGSVAVDGFPIAGELFYALDLSSFRVCTYAPRHASVMGWFQQKAPVPGRGLAYDICPRAILQRVLDDAHTLGLSFLTGFESEFILLKSTDPLATVNDADWSASAKTPTGSVEAAALEEMANCLIGGGVELQMYHAEAAPGQYELVTGPLSPLAAADALVYTRETIYNVASKHGLRATFAPRLHADTCGSGAHVHFSVHRAAPGSSGAAPEREAGACAEDGEAVKFGASMTRTERAFLQGILTALPALALLALPTRASYSRMADGIWSGGTYAAWGTDNKDAPLRLCGPSGHHHFELKTGDGTASPYLVLAAVLGAGVRAVREGRELSTGDCVKPVFLMDDAEKKALGLGDVKRLPRELGEARAVFEADEGVESVLGALFVQKYVAVNKLLEGYLQKETEEETVRRLVTFY